MLRNKQADVNTVSSLQTSHHPITLHILALGFTPRTSASSASGASIIASLPRGSQDFGFSEHADFLSSTCESILVLPIFWKAAKTGKHCLGCTSTPCEYIHSLCCVFLIQDLFRKSAFQIFFSTYSEHPFFKNSEHIFKKHTCTLCLKMYSLSLSQETRMPGIMTCQ